MLGGWVNKEEPKLPAGLQWNRQKFKYLGVFQRSNDFKGKNWEGVAEKKKCCLDGPGPVVLQGEDFGS